MICIYGNLKNLPESSITNKKLQMITSDNGGNGTANIMKDALKKKEID